MSDLQDFLLQGDVERERWVCDSLEKALWAARKVQGLARQRAEFRRAAEREIAKVTAWLAAVDKPLAESASFFEGALIDYHRRQLDADPSAKTVKLPGVVLKSREMPDAITVADTKAAIGAALLRGYPDLVRERDPELDLAALRKHLKDTGEMLPGVTVERQERKFTVQVTDTEEEDA